jgi:hypothetical protein
MMVHKKSFAAAWEGMFGSLEYEAVMRQDKAFEITIDWENGENDVMSAAEVYRLIYESNQPWMLSANGTIFTYEQEGIIPGLLKRWYSERKDMQKKLKAAIDAGNKIEEEYWDKRQLVKKINLNSLYGAILNAGCRFFDKRIGQSTTLVGRQISRHMAAKINEIITGDYDYRGRAIIYGDTDSAYFSAYGTLKTDIEKGHKGINAFIVEKGWAGFEIGPKEKKMGIRGSDTHSLMFTDVKIPKANRIGEDGFGFKFAMKTLSGGRIGIASQALGIASGAYELALAYSKERKAFGKEICNHQIIQFKLADMATKIEAARLLIYKSAWLKDQHLPLDKESAMAKVFASETAMWVTTEAVQIHGGYGFVKEYHVERLMRDAKITQIYEGTSEVQRIVISRQVLA